MFESPLFEGGLATTWEGNTLLVVPYVEGRVATWNMGLPGGFAFLFQKYELHKNYMFVLECVIWQKGK